MKFFKNQTFLWKAFYIFYKFKAICVLLISDADQDLMQTFGVKKFIDQIIQNHQSYWSRNIWSCKTCLNGKWYWVLKNKYEIGKKNNYDINRLNWSLEHVHYPSKYFEFISLNLSQNGIAIICVPNNDGMIYKLNMSCLELPIHLYHFNLETLTKFAKNLTYTFMITKVFHIPLCTLLLSNWI